MGEDKRSTTIEILVIFLLGVVLFLIDNTIYSALIDSFVTNIILKDLLTLFRPYLKNFYNIIIVTCAFLLIFKKILTNIWDYTLGNLTNHFIKNVNKELSEVNKSVSSITEEIKRYFIDQKKPLTLENCRNLADYEKIMMPVCKELFGKHIGEEQSFFSFIRKTYLGPFSSSPHPSSVTKKITLRNIDGPDHKDYVEWHEFTTYNIHSLLFEQKNQIDKYQLLVKTTSYAPDISEEEWSKVLKIKVRLEGESLIPPDQTPEFRRETHEDGFYCWRKGDWIEIRFQKQIELKAAFTRVECEEESINSKLDKVYTLNSSKPIYKHILDMTIPNDQEFIKEPFISAKLLYSGLPESVKKELPKGTSVEYNAYNHIHVEINEWVVPGIILNLNWINKSE